MALGTITVTSSHGGNPRAPRPVHIISFAGDDGYPTNGTPGFKALVQAKVGRAVTPLSVTPAGACGGYVPVYDKANDKLLVYGTGSANKAALTEQDNGTNLSGTTFILAVECE